MKQYTNKTVAGMKFWLLLVLAVFSLGQIVKAEVIYDNTTTRETSGGDTMVFAQSGYEFGDEVVLGGTARFLTNFSFEYYQNGIPAGATARLRIYSNDGTLYGTNFSAPGSLLYDSQAFTIGGNTDGFHTLEFTAANSGLAIPVSGSFTWTVEFGGITSGDAALSLYDAPTIGTDYAQYWELSGTNGSWVYRGTPDFNVNFGAQAQGINVVDAVLPTIAVKLPAAKSVFVSGPSQGPDIQVSGIAKDTGSRVALVLIRKQSGNFYPATITNKAPKTNYTDTGWYANVTLDVGTNNIYAKALDAAGNVATNKAVPYVYAVFKPLTLSVLQDGVVSSAPASIKPPWVVGSGTTNLMINKIYTFEVKPNKTYILSNTIVADDTTSTTYPNTTKKFNFTMTTNKSIVVNLGTNRYYSVQGQYFGLFGDTDTDQETGGLISVKISPGDKNKFSAKVTVGGEDASADGLFDLYGDSVGAALSKATKVEGKTYTVTVHTDFDGSDSISGVVENSTTHVQRSFTAYRNTWLDPLSTMGVEYATNYVMSIPGADDADVATKPNGYSHFTFTIKGGGKADVGGFLGNLEAIKQVGPPYISKEGKWPCFMTGSKDTDGQWTASVIGWLTFDTSPQSISGDVNILHGFNGKQASDAKYPYPSGFTIANKSVHAESWTPETTGYVIPLDNTLHTGTLKLTGGGFVTGTNLEVTATSDLKMTVTPLDAKKKSPSNGKVSSAPSKGGMSGQFDLPDIAKPGTKFQGVYFQTLNEGHGAFIGVSTSGKVRLSTP